MISGDGSSAIITLNGIRYESAPGDRTIELAIIDITLTATASVPFQYNAENIVFAYADDNNPYAHTQDGHVWGPSPMEDYTPYTPPDRFVSASWQRPRPHGGW